MDDKMIKKNIMYGILGMIVANTEDYNKISYVFEKEMDEYREPDEDKAELLNMDFLKKQKIKLDEKLENIIHEKKLQNAYYSCCFYGDSKTKKITMLITYQPEVYTLNEVKATL
ncbi:hypothetical protein [Treponema sp. R80B11-R83G3]